MAQLDRLTVSWTGFAGSPGYSVLHHYSSGDPQNGTIFYNAVQTMFATFVSYMPDDVKITVEPEMQVIESTTGELVDVFNVEVPGAVLTGIQPGAYSAPSGAVINWSTATIRNGRRLRGRTFLVPLSGAEYSASGQLSDITRGNLQGAVDEFATGTVTSPSIFGRPTQIGNDGVYGPITGGRVSSMVAVLKSRRD